jgi:hypothetical protein
MELKISRHGKIAIRRAMLLRQRTRQARELTRALKRLVRSIRTDQMPMIEVSHAEHVLLSYGYNTLKGKEKL